MFNRFLIILANFVHITGDGITAFIELIVMINAPKPSPVFNLCFLSIWVPELTDIPPSLMIRFSASLLGEALSL